MYGTVNMNYINEIFHSDSKVYAVTLKLGNCCNLKPYCYQYDYFYKGRTI